MSLRLAVLQAYLRWVERPRLARATPLSARAGFERQTQGLRLAPFTWLRGADGAEPPALWVEARPRGRTVLLWCHGGAHIMGSSRTHRGLLSQIALRTGWRVYVPDYRLAPEHPFPASLDDMRSAWHRLLRQGYRSDEIVLGGDSSGGGVVLALLSQLLLDGDRPKGLIALSPFTDLTGVGASFQENAARDPVLPAERLGEVVDYFLAGADPRDPRASPLFATFPDAPPVFLQVAETEILRDDSLRMAEALRSQDVEVTLDRWPAAPHVLAMFSDFIPEGREALRRIAAFARKLESD